MWIHGQWSGDFKCALWENHANQSQSGLCDKTFESSGSLAAHLTKCEVFMCANSGCRDYFITLETIKEHINEHHRKNAPAHYSFSTGL